MPVAFALGSISVFMAAHDVLRGRSFWIALGIIGAFSFSYPRLKKFVPSRSGSDIKENRFTNDKKLAT